MWCHYLWWIPAVIIYYAIYSWMSKINNEVGEKWIWYVYLFGALCPWWAIVSRISKNILFDGILYDNLMFLTYVFTLLLLGSGSKFLPHQWGGLVLVIVGSILLRIGI